MRVFYNIEEISGLKNPVVTTGSFDGLHKGHLQIIDKVISSASEIDGESLVITFDPHPREILDLPNEKETFKLLSTTREKISLFEQSGIDNLLIIKFDREFSKLSYAEYAENYLLRKIGARAIIIGYNHHYGHKREGSRANLESLQDRYDFRIIQVPMFATDSEKISSTLIRQLIKFGDIESANKLLWSNYSAHVDILSADEMSVDVKKLLPPDGRYNVNLKYRNSSVDTVITIAGKKILYEKYLLPITENNPAVITFLSNRL